MKTLPKLTLMFLTVSNLNTLMSQVYEPLAVENATWIMSGYGNYNLEGWAYRIEGDTIYNNLDYKKLYYYDLEVLDEELNGQKEFIVKSSKLFGLIRDDILNKKVFLKPIVEQYQNNEVAETCDTTFQNFDEEFQLHDFNKTIGDTINDCMLNFGYFEPIIQVDTLLNIYNQQRRVISLSPNFYDTFLTLIEGVGYSTGLFNTVYDFVSEPEGYFLYSHCVGSKWDCNLTTSIHQNILENPTLIYPNPIFEKITIEFSRNPKKLEIINDFGQTVKIIEGTSRKITLNLSDLNNGNYLMRIQYPNSRIEFKRFVKM